MKMTVHALFRFSVIATCSCIIATGCVLDRSPLLPGWGQVAPQQYCPGDTLTASYDFLGSDACATSGVNCADYFPTVTLTSTPMLFPSTSLPPGYTGSFPFSASGDSVAVGFHSSANPVTIPTDRFEGSSRVFLQRTNVTDTSATARRIVGTQSFELTHTGMCSGATPVYPPAELPGPPRLSSNLRLVDLCNTSGEAIRVTPGGGSGSTMLLPGMCLSSSAPDALASVDASRMYTATPYSGLPMGTCATGSTSTPPALRTVVRMTCR